MYDKIKEKKDQNEELLADSEILSEPSIVIPSTVGGKYVMKDAQVNKHIMNKYGPDGSIEERSIEDTYNMSLTADYIIDQPGKDGASPKPLQRQSSNLSRQSQNSGGQEYSVEQSNLSYSVVSGKKKKKKKKKGKKQTT